MTEQLVRVPLVENLDYKYGYISDGIVDPTPDRATFMARPAIRTLFDLGTPSTLPSGARFAYKIISQKIFAATFNKNATGVTSNQINTYHAVLYKSLGTIGGNVYGVFLYRTGVAGNAFIGSTDLTGGVQINESYALGKFSAAANTVNTMVQAVVASGGAGYNIGDSITLSYNGTNRYLILNVTGVSGGAVTSVSISNAGATPGTLTNPVPQLTTSGGGTGATFNLTFNLAQGLVLQWSQSSNNLAFIGVNLQTGGYVFQILYGAQNTPSPLFVSAATLNNYNFYVDVRGNLWNSDAGDPSVISATSFQQAFSDLSTQQVDLATHGGYLVAIGNNQVRFFQITGATNGSSVAPIQNFDYGIGSSQASYYFQSTTVSQLDEHLAFVGENDGTSISLFLYSPNRLVPEKVTFPYLEAVFTSGSSIVSGNFIHFRGRLCYQISFSNNSTYIYDVLTKIWYTWNVPTENAQFLGNYPRIIGNADSYADYTYLYGVNSADGPPPTINDFFVCTLQTAQQDQIVGLSAITYTPFIQLKPMDFGSVRSKQFSSAALIGDQTTSSKIATLSYSDDDAQTFSTPRNCDLSLKRDIKRNLGRAYRRQWMVTIPADWSVRLDALEVSYRQSNL